MLQFRKNLSPYFQSTMTVCSSMSKIKKTYCLHFQVRILLVYHPCLFAGLSYMQLLSSQPAVWGNIWGPYVVYEDVENPFAVHVNQCRQTEKYNSSLFWNGAGRTICFCYLLCTTFCLGNLMDMRAHIVLGLKNLVSYISRNIQMTKI